MSALSICMVCDDFVPGLTGVGIHVQTISKALAQRGHRIAVITARHPGQPEYEEWQEVRVYRVPSLPVFGYRQALSTPSFLRRVLDENAVDIVHYQYLGLLLLQAYHAAASLDRKVKHIYTYHMPVDLLSDPWPLRPLRGFLRRLHVDYCNRFDLVLAPSHGLLDEMRDFGIRTRTEVIFNPVETGHMQTADKSRSSAERRAPGGFVVLYVGRLAPEKNLPLLIHGFALLQQRVCDAELWLAGDGISRKQLQELVTGLELGERVRFLGFIDHAKLGELYSNSDVLVLPSKLEVQGLVAVEAMRFGKPIVVSDRIAAATELVTQGVNGYVVPADDPAELARRLEVLATDPALRIVMGEASVDRSQSYNVDHCVDKLEGAYRAAVG